MARRLDVDLSLFTLLAQQSGNIVGVLSHALREFIAGWSMREVAATVLLKVRGPSGEPLGTSP